MTHSQWKDHAAAEVALQWADHCHDCCLLCVLLNCVSENNLRKHVVFMIWEFNKSEKALNFKNKILKKLRICEKMKEKSQDKT